MDGQDGLRVARSEKETRVLVVDDSAFMRYIISKELSADPAILVVGMARDGLDALQKIPQLRPDVVTMDLEMPRMDGLTALEKIMTEMPVPVILLSSWSQEGAAVTIRGLELGAADFVPKPSAVQAAASDAVWHQLIAKVKGAGSLDGRRLGNKNRLGSQRVREVTERAAQPAPSVRPAAKAEKVVVIGTSTGGPRALFEVVPRLPAGLQAGVLLVQHMPPGFTRSLASRLNDVSRLQVREAAEGDLVQTGLALLAPGDFHLTVRRGGRIALEKTPAVHGVRPSVDITMEAAASVYGAFTVGVVLTGMGVDGTSGALAIRRAGGLVMAEDESTCVVYGMPRSVCEAGAANRVVRLEAMAEAIVDAVSGEKKEVGTSKR
ncbi:MAG: chemotaxis response regulator protein-glutamate methylesterase [Chloroflexi bacterium]|nr:chemotaxis response regulator protein-glutamate methylesterase [Chloroflexota bacterium]